MHMFAFIYKMWHNLVILGCITLALDPTSEKLSRTAFYFITEIKYKQGISNSIFNLCDFLSFTV